MWEQILGQLQMFIGVAVAAVLGFSIGFERKLRSKEAGIGTHTVVCIGAALMVIVSKYGFGADADAARVAAQIVSGIGFLGAGIIVYRQHEIHGLTTAAGVWATAGIGMACGAGLYVVAVLATVLIIAIQCLFHLPKVLRHKRFYRLSIVFLQEGNQSDEIKRMFGVEHFHCLEMKQEDGHVRCSVTVFTATEFPSASLTEIMKNHPYILSIHREDQE